MSNTIAYVDNQTLTNIADAVRYKTGINEKMLLSDIPNKIRNIEGIVPTGTQTITENGEYDVLNDKSVTVDVNPDLRPLSVSENGQYSPDGFDGFSQVSVDVPEYLKQYLIAEDVYDTARNDIFCNYWTEKYVPVIDETRYAFYIIQVENNTASTGAHWLFYGLRDNKNIVIAVRINPYRLIELSALDSKTYNLFVSAGAIVRVYAIPKITS